MEPQYYSVVETSTSILHSCVGRHLLKLANKTLRFLNTLPEPVEDELLRAPHVVHAQWGSFVLDNT
jgi:hypothetical protein